MWKRLPTRPGGSFEGHAQTVQNVSPPKVDPHDPAKTQEGSIAVVQGNMHDGKGAGLIEQRVYSFTELTGHRDGDGDIGEEPKGHEESFFGAEPWKS